MAAGAEHTLHLALGDMAGGALAEAGLVPADGLLAFKDEVSVGPLTPLDDDEAWGARRVAFWQDVVRGQPLSGMTGAEEAAASLPVDEVVPGQLQELRSRLRGAGAVEIWIGETQQDLLFAALVAHVARQEAVEPARVALRQYHDDDDDVMDSAMDAPGLVGRARHGIATLASEDLARAPEAVSIEGGLDDELFALWRAVTAPEPAPLVALAKAPGRLPGLGPALKTRLRRFPDEKTGLVAAQALLLSHCAPEWTPSPRLIGAALRDNAGPDRFGDLALFRILRRMADPKLPEPPVEIRGNHRSIPGSSARLTTFGQMILQGDADHWRSNGIDLWVGGVHVSSELGAVWVTDGVEVTRA